MMMSQDLSRLSPVVVTFWLLLAWLLMSPATASERWQVLVLPANNQQQPSQLAASSDITDNEIMHARRSIDDAITAQLIGLGFDVYDKQLLNLPGCKLSQCSELEVQQLLDRIRMFDDKINLLVSYDFSVIQPNQSADHQWQLLLSGYIIDLASGRRIDQWSGLSRQSTSPANCRNECLSHWLSDQSTPLASTLGDILARKLEYYQRIFDYRLQLQGFVFHEVTALENYLRSLDGYPQGGLRLTGEVLPQYQWLHQIYDKHYVYQSALAGGHLAQKLQAVLDVNDVAGRVAYDSQRREFVITRQGLPYGASYTLLAFVLLLAVIVLGVLIRNGIHQRRLALLAREKRLVAGVGYLERLQRHWLPGKANWSPLLSDWQDKRQQSARLLTQAKDAVRHQEYEQASRYLAQSVSLESDNDIPAMLMDHLSHWQTGEALLAQLQTALPQNKTDKTDNMVNADSPYKILSHIDEGLQTLNSTRGASSEIKLLISQQRERLMEQRRQVLGWMTPMEEMVVGNGTLAHWHISPREQLLIGRKGPANCVNEQADLLAIGFKRLSRIGKQCLLERRGTQWFITDQGSSNGSYLCEATSTTGQWLAPNQPQQLMDEQQLSMGGSREPLSPGPCCLQLTRPDSSPLSLLLKFEQQSLRLYEKNSLANWPSAEVDRCQRWLMLAEPVPVGINETGQLDPGCVSKCPPLFFLRYEDGYWIRPVDPEAQQVCVGGAILHGEVPLQGGVRVNVGKVSFSLSPSAISSCDSGSQVQGNRG